MRSAARPRRERGLLVGLILLVTVIAERVGRVREAAHERSSRPAERPGRSPRRWPRPLRRALLLMWMAGGLAALGDQVPPPLALPILKPAPNHSVEVVQTTEDLSQRMTRLKDLQFVAGHPPGVPVIHVDDSHPYQRVRGFGAAMTDTSAWLLHDELPADRRASAFRELFSSEGIHLNFLRIPIGASDFTKDGLPYSYDDRPRGQTDPGLIHFSIAHDLPYIIPSLRQVFAVNPHLQTLASPWSPPAWMKGNDSLDNRQNAGTLLSSAYGQWAHYFVRFLQDYARHGIRIDAITPQNEPTNPTRYPGLNLDSQTQAKLILDYLLPALERAKLHQTIYGSDLGWDSYSASYTGDVAERAGGSLAGMTRHCYAGAPGVMSSFHSVTPRLEEMIDECTTGLVPEQPAEMVISSMRNWATLVATWNLALDPQGGPVQPPNHGCAACTGLMTVDENAHSVRPNGSYYQFGQASAFVRPGARRIASEHFVSYQYDQRSRIWVSPGLDDIAYVNSDGSKVLLAYNSAAHAVRFAVEWHHRSFSYTLPAEGTVTFVWDRPS